MNAVFTLHDWSLLVHGHKVIFSSCRDVHGGHTIDSLADATNVSHGTKCARYVCGYVRYLAQVELWLLIIGPGETFWIVGQVGERCFHVCVPLIMPACPGKMLTSEA